MATGDLVLVTGASGFIAGHCIKAVLERGYRVRATVRRPEAVAEAREALGEAAGDVAFVLAALDDDDGWPEAVAGCRFVLHTASPTKLIPPRDPDKLVRPARDGALRVLAAAAAAGVERTVMTSSGAAILNNPGHPPGHVFTEADWSDPEAGISAYALSKTLAERAAWRFMAEDRSGMTLAAINPTAVLGPVLDNKGGASGGLLVKLLIGGRLPALARLAFTVVDVRDVAEAHLRALEVPEAAGERFIVASEAVWLADMARFLAQAIPARARKIPRREMPMAVLNGIGRLFPVVGGLLRNHQNIRPVSNQNAQTRLAMRFRGAEEAVVAMGQSLVEHGVV